jgi:hypothetical protein
MRNLTSLGLAYSTVNVYHAYVFSSYQKFVQFSSSSNRLPNLQIFTMPKKSYEWFANN